jgi:hypothetical protein
MKSCRLWKYEIQESFALNYSTIITACALNEFFLSKNSSIYTVYEVFSVRFLLTFFSFLADLLTGDLNEYRPWHKANSSVDENQRALR